MYIYIYISEIIRPCLTTVIPSIWSSDLRYMIILRLLLAPIEASNFTWTPLSNAARRMLSSNVGQYLSTQSQLYHCELEYCPVSERPTFGTTRLLSSSCNSIGFAWDGQLIGQPILELSSHLLEIPNDAHYATPSYSDWLFDIQWRVL